MGKENGIKSNCEWFKLSSGSRMQLIMMPALVEYLRRSRLIIIAHGGGDTDFFISNLELANQPIFGEQDILADWLKRPTRMGLGYCG